tara:strand:- start:15114 stop:17549 length:2436 start_codon:yes stop_codon:yes gene_type:complete
MPLLTELLQLYTALNENRALSPREVNELMMLNRQQIRELLQMQADYQATKVGALKDLKAEEIQSHVEVLKILTDLEKAGIQAASKEKVALYNGLVDLNKIDGDLTGRSLLRKVGKNYQDIDVILERQKGNWTAQANVPKEQDPKIKVGQLEDLQNDIFNTITNHESYGAIKGIVMAESGTARLGAAARARDDISRKGATAFATALYMANQEAGVVLYTNEEIAQSSHNFANWMQQKMKDPTETRAYIPPASQDHIVAYNDQREQRDRLVLELESNLGKLGPSGRSAISRFKKMKPMLGGMNADEIVRNTKELLEVETPLDISLQAEIDELKAAKADIRALGVSDKDRFVAIMSENPLYVPLKKALQMDDNQMVRFMTQDGTADRWFWTEHLLKKGQGWEDGVQAIPPRGDPRYQHVPGGRPRAIRTYLENQVGMGIGGQPHRIRKGIANLAKYEEVPVSLPEPDPRRQEAIEGLGQEVDDTPRIPAPAPPTTTPAPARPTGRGRTTPSVETTAGVPSTTVEDPANKTWGDWGYIGEDLYYKQKDANQWKRLPDKYMNTDAVKAVNKKLNEMRSAQIESQKLLFGTQTDAAPTVAPEKGKTALEMARATPNEVSIQDEVSIQGLPKPLQQTTRAQRLASAFDLGMSPSFGRKASVDVSTLQQRLDEDKKRQAEIIEQEEQAEKDVRYQGRPLGDYTKEALQKHARRKKKLPTDISGDEEKFEFTGRNYLPFKKQQQKAQQRLAESFQPPSTVDTPVAKDDVWGMKERSIGKDQFVWKNNRWYNAKTGAPVKDTDKLKILGSVKTKAVHRAKY